MYHFIGMWYHSDSCQTAVLLHQAPHQSLSVARRLVPATHCKNPAFSAGNHSGGRLGVEQGQAQNQTLPENNESMSQLFTRATFRAHSLRLSVSSRFSSPHSRQQQNQGDASPFLKRITTLSRNTVTQDRLNALAMLSMEMKLVRNIPDFNNRVSERFSTQKGDILVQITHTYIFLFIYCWS